MVSKVQHTLFVNQWLEDAWRHGEIVADEDGRLVGAGGPRRASLARRVWRRARRVLESVSHGVRFARS